MDIQKWLWERFEDETTNQFEEGFSEMAGVILKLLDDHNAVIVSKDDLDTLTEGAGIAVNCLRSDGEQSHDTEYLRQATELQKALSAIDKKD